MVFDEIGINRAKPGPDADPLRGFFCGDQCDNTGGVCDITCWQNPDQGVLCGWQCQQG